MKFLLVTPLLATLILETASHVVARAADDGKYNKRKYVGGNRGKYRHTNEGDYVEDLDRYRYVHYDDGDRGRYIHVHIPYDGGYGNYAGGHEPFRNPPYDATGLYAYVQRPKNDTCLRLIEQYFNTCSDPSVDSVPFRTSDNDVQKPSLYLEYGTPYPELNYQASTHREKQAARSAEPDPRASKFPGIAYLPALETPIEQRSSKELSTEPRKQLSPVSFEIGSIPMTSSSPAHDAKLRIITESSDTTASGSTPSYRSTTERSVSPASFTFAPSTTTRGTIEQQLLQCQAELADVRRNLSRTKL